MATTDNCIEYDIKFYQHLKPYLGLTAQEEISMEAVVKRGFIQRDRLVEEAIAIVGNRTIVSVAGRDFCDGSDAKSVVSSERNNNIAKGGWTISMIVRSIKTKTGALRIIGYNKLLDKFYYFVIPNTAFSGLASVEIVIECFCRAEFIGNRPNFTGEPRRDLKWWSYEVSTFEELARNDV